MAEKVVWLYCILVVICVHSFAEETENLSETDHLKGSRLTSQDCDVVNKFCISFYSQLKLCINFIS